ncbi:4-hydroxythreonine-4-phosphate dehydrogenase [Verticiella sediminum]|uniref:4-hydroxythreonine-4-phosphate dehydrogenase n=1 Tax=Verticiella sediminum TaxID=1247510 RepID=A0A556B093_9BURK|nr:4-hydroxythreonine-4-phosphate dehydrogenase PdxA [Verticiella sediminum]TSH98608.1 4-hydroxythreonine-4-phosphate dehydrogenase [Verticiella sediminum]
MQTTAQRAGRAPVRLALAVGDPNGIGPEIALKALQACDARSDLALTLYGPSGPLLGTARALGLEDILARAAWVPTGDLPAGAWAPGQVNAEAGAATVAAASAAIRACRAGVHDAVIACPHHETAIHRAGIAFSGYPSLLAQVGGQPEAEVFLMLVGGGLRIVHVTLHQSLRSALDDISIERIVAAARAGVRACAGLGLVRPRIGLFGINPHASEGGLFGGEDEALAVPAAERLRALGIAVDGPLGADTLLADRAHDLYVAMWHDQGHIPVKLLAPRAASALSIGAGVLLSSVGHGSAMDIAGKGLAEPTALLRTIDLFAGMPAAAPPGDRA